MKLNKKGFTIVELVIVIAVIAILAAVMIPTFSGIIAKAQESAAKQQFMAAYKEGLALALSDGAIEEDESEPVDNNKFTVTFVDTTYEANVAIASGDIHGYKAANIKADGTITLSK